MEDTSAKQKAVWGQEIELTYGHLAMPPKPAFPETRTSLLQPGHFTHEP